MQEISEAEWREWYARKDVISEMLRHVHNREFAALSKQKERWAVRNLKVWNDKGISYWIGRGLHAPGAPLPFYNFYHSLATYERGLPDFLNSWNIRARELGNWHQEQHKMISEYDLLIDIDMQSREDFSKAKHTAVKVSKALRMPHEIVFSGFGFHLKVSGTHARQDLSTNPFDDVNVYGLYQALLKELNEKYPLVDLKVSGSRRLCRIPGSLNVYPERQAMVCYAFDCEDEFTFFKYDHALPSRWKRKNFAVRKPFLFKKNMTVKKENIINEVRA